MLENIATILGIIGSILGIIGSIVTIIVGIIGFNRGFQKGSSINVSGIEYSFKNLKQQSQHVRSKVFKLIRVYMCMIISNIILYYCCTEIFSVLVEEIKTDGTDPKNIDGAIGSTIGSTIGWLYFFIWFATLIYILIKNDVGRIIFEDIEKIKAREKIEDRFFKLIYGYSFIYIIYEFIIQKYNKFIECFIICFSKLFIDINYPWFFKFYIDININCPWFLKSFVKIILHRIESPSDMMKLILLILVEITLFLCLLFSILLPILFLCFSRKGENNQRKGILTDFTKLNLILHYCMALNPFILCISLDMKFLKKVLHLNTDFPDNILRLGIVVAINLVVVIIVYFISNKFYSKMMNTAFLYYNDNDGKRYIYRKIDNQVLCGNKDYLQCNREPFDDELRKIKEQIKKKKWDKKVRHELEKEIDRLKPYSGYIKIEEAEEKFKELNDCIKQYKAPVDNTTNLSQEEKTVDMVPVHKPEGGVVYSPDCGHRIGLDSDKNSSDDIKKKIDKIIETFETKIAVKLLPEDELKNYTIYPIIDKERSGFFS